MQAAPWPVDVWLADRAWHEVHEAPLPGCENAQLLPGALWQVVHCVLDALAGCLAGAW